MAKEYDLGEKMIKYAKKFYRGLMITKAQIVRFFRLIYRKLFVREYHITIFLDGDKLFSNGKHYMTISLSKIKRINNKRIVGLDKQKNYYELKCRDPFYYEIKRRM